ncbi:pyridoxal phosphate-dependent aminotransferase [Xylocopilactobacillus apicola]|uniref:Aminotransferase n=1 Tax=Xylocopilactobacillus apicola TaxID=2932184 RepID=A0AAU9DZA0_9LACO|nr:pyridoxal phosphate-dependent aminotransferase [Xylocopilactobacillus apicola]BDR59598.1 aminotransferase [Xylocopilactobacillus apicola]
MKNYRFAKRMAGVGPSATLQMGRRAKELAQQGADVIDLSVGEPDFATPGFITKAAKQAIDAGLTSFYTPTLGLDELRRAIANNHQTIDPLSRKNVGVATGAKLVLYALMQILISDGEKVVIPAPYWVSYSQQVLLCQGNVFAVYPQNPAMKLTTAELLELDFMPKAVIINNPTNPTGALYTKDELQELIDWAAVNDVFLIVDEIYGNLVYNGAKFTSVLELSGVKDSQLIVVDGVSKTYSMTGWRIGWAIADEQIIVKMGEVLDHMTSNPAAVSQYAALAAINSDNTAAKGMREIFESRLNYSLNALEDIPGLTMAEKPQGAFYCFLRVDPAILARKKLTCTNELVLDLLDKKHVALAAGEGFDLPGYVRLSYAKDEKILQAAFARIKEYLTND